MVESKTEPKYLRVIHGEEKIVSMESSGSVPVIKDYDSKVDGDLFLFQIAQALDGVKEILPEVNFRRKHPKLGQKIGDLERRLRKVEETIRNIKYFLKPELQNGIKRLLLEDFECRKEEFWDDL